MYMYTHIHTYIRMYIIYCFEYIKSAHPVINQTGTRWKKLNNCLDQSLESLRQTV